MTTNAMADSAPALQVNGTASGSEQAGNTEGTASAASAGSADSEGKAETDAKAESKAKSGESRAKAKLSKAALQKIRAGKAVSVAKKQIGDPYRWGATGPGAFDCSGLVKYAWGKAGVTLPRITHSQYRAIRKKVSWSNLRPGDLLFFSGKGHVGMYVGKGRMVHSPSSGKTVRIVKLKGHYRSSFAGAARPGA
ncbi:cell wall-associated NlpC family hydrolase [Streptosporangium becharense]|uniref:Cell wall-associated NlpC family hydrolase n=1 Tax=Streptosporangium becharense TaxID=1816182 RepID=A0A7W9MFI4_9ACTN|nr:C40 family peptidase [Streptosporangium becharense]MBB2911882.1 cell wall-associated NlpC family hydrolase [Streptosporangium becharense]MBB5818429.1 cell wall-associated NlpC family hydrolase [Streptosporangium becharense]